MKSLVAVALNSAFVFISELFTGSISDRKLFIASDFLELLKTVPASKSIMADKGFEIQNLLVPFNLLLNIPPFKGQQSLSKKDVITQKIA